MEEKGTATKFLDASNRFYTLMPHDFGMQKPPMIDNIDAVKVRRIAVVVGRISDDLFQSYFFHHVVTFTFRIRHRCWTICWRLK